MLNEVLMRESHNIKGLNKKKKSNLPMLVLMYMQFILFATVLPTYGQVFISSILGSWMLFLLTIFIVLANVLVAKRISKYTLGIFLMCAYFFTVTVFYHQHQQISFVYYASAVFMIYTISASIEFSAQKSLDIRRVFGWSIFPLIVYVFLFAQNSFSAKSIATASSASAIYYILTLLPFILSVQNKKIRISGAIIILLCCLLSLKRTAILAVFFALVCYQVVLSNKTGKGTFFIVFRVLFWACSLTVIVFLVNDWFGLQVTRRFGDLLEDGGSNRSYIYQMVWEKLWNQTFSKCLFGSGFNGTRYVFDIISGYEGTIVSAHNDFLEVLVDYGLLGFVMYAWFVIKQIKNCVFSIRNNSEYAAAMVANLVIFIVISLFSHLIIYPSYYINILAFWAITRMDTRMNQTSMSQ